MWRFSMKKTSVFIVILLFTLTLSMTCRANIMVQPAELSITMTNEFIHGNNSKKITIINNDNCSFNATWYLEHPTPVSWMRPNRTYMPNLSWIDLEPKWLLIPSNSTREFYVHLDIPENEELTDEHWETCVTFKLGKQDYGGGLFNQEYAVRVYMDTPVEVTIGNHQGYDLLYIALAAVTAIAVLIIWKLVIKKNRS